MIWPTMKAEDNTAVIFPLYFKGSVSTTYTNISALVPPTLGRENKSNLTHMQLTKAMNQ